MSTPLSYVSLQSEPPAHTSDLTGFETRCLSKKLCDCEMMLRQALLGATEVQAKSHAATTAVEICLCLARAELEVERARALAAGFTAGVHASQGGHR